MNVKNIVYHADLHMHNPAVIQRVRVNYKYIYDLISKSGGNVSMFNRRCDICRLIKPTYTGDVVHLAFFCIDCCTSIKSSRCIVCKRMDITKNRVCILCHAVKKRKYVSTLGASISFIGRCHTCSCKLTYLTTINKRKLCMKCCNTVKTCNICGVIDIVINDSCNTCKPPQVSDIVSYNYYYPLTLIDDD